MYKTLLSTILVLSVFITVGQCDYNEVIATVTTGEWATEMSFSIVDEAGYEVGYFQGVDDGQTGDTTLCLMDGCYLLTAEDTWGDGWNGGSVELDIDGELLEYSLEDGQLGFLTFGVNTEDCYFEIPGCTDSTALNYSPDFNIDDGSCINILEFDFNKEPRQYLYYEPEGIQPGAPLIFVLHGWGGNAWSVYDGFGFNELADEHGFTVCYPYGMDDDSGIPHWNSGLNISEVDDLGFLSNLAIFLQEEHGLGADCTYACGMSNGGYMSYHLACEASDIFKAIASVTGTMSAYDWEVCDPTNPVPVLEIHGDADTVVPYGATEADPDGWYGAEGVEAVHDFWVAQNQCTDSTEFTFEDIVPGDNTTVDARIHTNGINGNQVWLYTVVGGGHNWPGLSGNFDINTVDEIWNFFSQVSTCAATSIEEEMALQSIDIWPNPSAGSVTISSEKQGTAEIWDINGRLVDRVNIRIGNNELNELESGIYVVQVVWDDGQIAKSERLIVF